MSCLFASISKEAPDSLCDMDIRVNIPKMDGPIKGRNKRAAIKEAENYYHIVTIPSFNSSPCNLQGMQSSNLCNTIWKVHYEMQMLSNDVGKCTDK